MRERVLKYPRLPIYISSIVDRYGPATIIYCDIMRERVLKYPRLPI